jgi:HTH-type transcriptional regulator / antitoxin HipB
MDTLRLQSPSHLSLHLKSLRKARRVTQAQMAQRLHITQSRYAQIERAPESISTARFLDILAVLGVDVLLKLRQEGDSAAARQGEDW